MFSTQPAERAVDQLLTKKVCMFSKFFFEKKNFFFQFFFVFFFLSNINGVLFFMIFFRCFFWRISLNSIFFFGAGGGAPHPVFFSVFFLVFLCIWHKGGVALCRQISNNTHRARESTLGQVLPKKTFFINFINPR